VAVILIVLTGVLVNTMIQTESNTQNIISDIEEQSRLESVAELTRADAIQIFNFGIRNAMHRYLADPSNKFTITEWADWDSLVDEFAEGTFGGTTRNAFAVTTANYLIGLYRGFGFSFGSYRITIEENEAGFREIMGEIIQASIDTDPLNPDEANFFEVIECDGTLDNCELGTFYVNLKLSKLTSEQRESLPRIVVEDRSTGRILKDPILPNNDVRILVPLRVFKALTITRAMALGQDGVAGGFDGLMDEDFSGNNGKLDAYGLGACVPNSCDKFWNLTREQSLPDGKACVGQSACSAGACPESRARVGPRNYEYDLQEAIPAMRPEFVLAKVIRDDVCDLIKNRGDIPLRLIGTDFGIASGGGSEGCDVRGEDVAIRVVPDITSLATNQLKLGIVAGNAHCAGMSSLVVEVQIDESNETYMVDKDLPTEYKIRMVKRGAEANPASLPLPIPAWTCETTGRNNFSCGLA
jgi:hypothetical protein